MENSTLYPLTFEPVFKDYLWGSRNLEKLGRRLPEGIIAESWEIAAHEHGTTVIDNGYFAGKLLTEVHELLGLDLIGMNNAWAQERRKFPLLIKLLDASLPLSVQVHPKDDYALEHEGNELGKTEMWIILHADPGAAITMGVKKGTMPATFQRAIHAGDLDRYLHQIPVEAGDVICVPAGSLHAILGGLIIAEIQQNSDATYRVFDWNRVDGAGRKRPLHIKKALDVINFEQIEPGLCLPQQISAADGVYRYLLCHNHYFVTERVEIEAGTSFNGRCDGTTLEIWGVIEGEVGINEVELSAVRFALLPAAMGEFGVRAHQKSTLLRTYVDG